MAKRILFAIVLSVLVVAGLATSPAQAGNHVQATGYHQILSNEESGAVVRVWVSNTCRSTQFVLVTVIAQSNGESVKSVYTLYLPGGGVRPLDLSFAKGIDFVDKIIVTELGGSKKK